MSISNLLKSFTICIKIFIDSNFIGYCLETIVRYKSLYNYSNFRCLYFFCAFVRHLESLKETIVTTGAHQDRTTISFFEMVWPGTEAKTGEELRFTQDAMERFASQRLSSVQKDKTRWVNAVSDKLSDFSSKKVVTNQGCI